MASDSTSERLLTEKDLAARWQIKGANTLPAWRKAGRVPKYFLLGVHPRYPLAEVEAWEREHLQGSPANGNRAHRKEVVRAVPVPRAAGERKHRLGRHVLCTERPVGMERAARATPNANSEPNDAALRNP